MVLIGKHIIITSNEPWGDMWFSKQHYAYELSKRGNVVYFVNPVGAWRLMNLFRFKAKKKQVHQNLYVLNYYNHFPIRLYPRSFQRLNDSYSWYKIQKLLPTNTPIILWQFDLFRFTSTIKRKNITRIYHVVDSYMHHSNDKKLAALADLIICTSKGYLTHYKKWKNKCIYIPHGIPEDELSVDSEKVKEVKMKYGSFFILTGTIGLLNDIKLIQRIALEFPKQLIIAGSVRLKESENFIWEKLLEEEKLIYIGVIPGKSLKNWIAAASFCIVAYRFNLTQTNFGSSSALKFLNYLAQKKAIVSSIDGEMEDLLQKGIYYAENEDDFLNKIRLGTEGNLPVNETIVDELLIKRRYDILLEQIEEALSNV